MSEGETFIEGWFTQTKLAAGERSLASPTGFAPAAQKPKGRRFRAGPLVPYSFFVLRSSLSHSAFVSNYAHPLVDPQFAHL